MVTLLPQMLAAADQSVNHLEAAAPVVSGFLGGYVVAMPLLGAYSDARGRLPAYAASMAVFGAGSVVTATATGLPWMVAGRILQGMGGGALVPLTLALAADLTEPGRRTLALGAVSALQEAGSVLGPLYGAVVAAGLGGWRAVFWLNLPLGLLLAAALLRVTPPPAAAPRLPGGRIDWASGALLGLTIGLGVAALYPDDPGLRPVNGHALPLGLGALLAGLGLIARQRSSPAPLVPRALIRRRAFAGGAAANLLTGAALMVALVDIPVLARGVYGLSTLDSGLFLSRLLLGIPLGAILGGWLGDRGGLRLTAAGGLALTGAAFLLMSTWRLDELELAAPRAGAELFAAGLGFGLVIAPLAAAALDAAGRSGLGVAGGISVLSRTLGMILGLAALTAFGLARFGAIFAARGCGNPGGGGLGERLRLFETCVRGSLLQEYRETFVVASLICAVGAAVAAAALPGRARSE